MGWHGHLALCHYSCIIGYLSTRFRYQLGCSTCQKVSNSGSSQFKPSFHCRNYHKDYLQLFPLANSLLINVSASCIRPFPPSCSCTGGHTSYCYCLVCYVDILLDIQSKSSRIIV